MRTNYKRLENILARNFNCKVIKSPARGIVAIFNQGTEDEQRVRVILIDYSHHKLTSAVGIHCKLLNKSDLEDQLVDAVETATKDLFPAIYIHQKSKAPRRSKDSLIEVIHKWIEASRKTGVTYSLNKPFVPVEDTLNTMNEDQLEAVLMLISMGYQKSGEDSRRFRRSLKDSEVAS